MNKSFARLFIKFFMPYFLIIVMLVAAGSIAYMAALNQIEEKTMRIQQANIEQSKSVLDGRFKEAIDASLQLQQIPLVNAFKTRTRESLDENYFSAVELFNQLKNIRFVSEVIEEYYILYRNSGIIANSKSMSYYNDQSETMFGIEGYSKAEYWDYVLDDFYFGTMKNTEMFLLSETRFEGAPLLTTVGYNYGEPEAVILTILSSDKLRESMEGYQQNKGGNFLIIDEEDRVLLSLNPTVGIDEKGFSDVNNMGDEYTMIKVSSDVTAYNYVYIQRTDELYSESYAMRETAIVSVIIVFLVGMVTSLISASYNTKPVHKMANNNQVLQERVKNQLPYIRMNFLERWLKGNYRNIDELKSITKYLKASYIGDYYCVVVVDYDERIDIMEDLSELNINKLEMKRLLVKDVLTEEILKPEYVHDLDHDKLAIILISDTNDPAVFELYVNKQIRQCSQVLQDNELNEIHFGVGNVYKEMSEVSTSLNNALDALTTISNSNEKEVIWYAELPENMDSYFYPPEIEMRLYNCTRAGDTQQVALLLREILKKNVFEKTLPSHMLKIFIYEIWGTLAKVQERAIGEENEVNAIIVNAFEKIESMSDLEKIQYCKSTFTEVCNVINLEREGKQDNVMDNINIYVDTNYKDPDFCLPMVAEKFNLSYAYLSQIFKDFNNESFINYLQKLRMKEAERLLLETNMPVKDIVTACGYNSSNTFGKAFKRIHGVSASVFRERKTT